MKKAACALLLFVCVDAAAAVAYRLQGSSGTSGRVLADGPRVRLDFDNGTVLITSDGGKTLTLLDPATKTFTVVSAAGLVGADVAVSNAKSAARDLGNSGALEGYPTRRWVLDSTFDITIDPSEPKMNVHVTLRSESWRTERLPETAAGLGMGQASRTGIASLDKLLDSMSAANMKGFPLKEVTTIRLGPRGGDEMTETWTVEAHDVRTGVAATPAQFAIPAGYRKR